MLLEGSCACSRVKFSVQSETPYPYQLCYCNACRKNQGCGGYSINIMGLQNTFKIHSGEDQLRYYQIPGGSNRRYFCSNCGSFLWAYSDEWPQWTYPYASAIDTALPVPPNRTHIMLVCYK